MSFNFAYKQKNHSSISSACNFYLFYLFIFGCVGSPLLHMGFFYLQRAGATLCCGAQASHCGGFSCCGAWALGVRASVVAARGLSSFGSRALEPRLSCSAACGIFLDQGSKPCSLHWQVDSQPLRHQGGPVLVILISVETYFHIILVTTNISKHHLHPSLQNKITGAIIITARAF